MLSARICICISQQQEDCSVGEFEESQLTISSLPRLTLHGKSPFPCRTQSAERKTDISSLIDSWASPIMPHVISSLVVVQENQSRRRGHKYMYAFHGRIDCGLLIPSRDDVREYLSYRFVTIRNTRNLRVYCAVPNKQLYFPAQD